MKNQTKELVKDLAWFWNRLDACEAIDVRKAITRMGANLLVAGSKRHPEHIIETVSPLYAMRAASILRDRADGVFIPWGLRPVVAALLGMFIAYGLITLFGLDSLVVARADGEDFGRVEPYLLSLGGIVAAFVRFTYVCGLDTPLYAMLHNNPILHRWTVAMWAILRADTITVSPSKMTFKWMEEKARENLLEWCMHALYLEGCDANGTETHRVKMRLRVYYDLFEDLGLVSGGFEPLYAEAKIRNEKYGAVTACPYDPSCAQGI